MANTLLEALLCPQRRGQCCIWSKCSLNWCWIDGLTETIRWPCPEASSKSGGSCEDAGSKRGRVRSWEYWSGMEMLLTLWIRLLCFILSGCYNRISSLQVTGKYSFPNSAWARDAALESRRIGCFGRGSTWTWGKRAKYRQKKTWSWLNK